MNANRRKDLSNARDLIEKAYSSRIGGKK